MCIHVYVYICYINICTYIYKYTYIVFVYRVVSEPNGTLIRLSGIRIQATAELHTRSTHTRDVQTSSSLLPATPGSQSA